MIYFIILFILLAIIIIWGFFTMNSAKKINANLLDKYAAKNGFTRGLGEANELEKLLSEIDINEGKIRVSYWNHKNIFSSDEIILCNLSESDSSLGRRGSSTSQRSAVIFECTPELKTLLQITKESKVNILFLQETASENKLFQNLLSINFNDLPHNLQIVCYNGTAIIYFIPMFTTENEEDISYFIEKSKELKNILAS